MKFFLRRRRHSYNDLWHIVYGGLHEGDKGLLRERLFAVEVLSGWRSHADFLMELARENRDTIQRIRDLHQPVYRESWMEAEAGGEVCSSCLNQPYPCKTRKALDGEQE